MPFTLLRVSLVTISGYVVTCFGLSWRMSSMSRAIMSSDWPRKPNIISTLQVGKRSWQAAMRS